jgi:hypothetical protein
VAKRTQVLVPTAVNTLMFINDSFITSRKAGDDMTVVLPSIRQRAKLVVNGEGSLQVSVEVPGEPASIYTR